MKRFLTAMPLVFAMLWALAGCGSDNCEECGLVFVNNSDAAIVEVVADFTDQTSGARRADSCPLKQGESFGFEVGEYPVTLTVYDQLFEDSGQKELASITINGAPPEGERWYVTARDGMVGLVLSADTRWPRDCEPCFLAFNAI